MWAVAGLLLTLVLPAVSAPAPPELWQGTMTYPCTAACCDGAACVKFLAHDSPINITVRPAAVTGGLSSADMAWTWTVLPRPGAPNGHCVPKLEAGLNVSTKGGKWFAQGSGGTSEYYSLEATLSADGNTLSNGIIYAGAAWPGTADGTFSAQKGGARPTATCVTPPPAPPPPPPSPNLWPLPRNYTNGTAPLRVPSASFRFDCDRCAEVLTAAFGRYTKQIFAEHSTSSTSSSSSAPALASLAVHVSNVEEHTSLQLGMDESYILRIPSGGTQATLTAPTVWGALRGLETFSQLVEWDWDNATHVIRGAPWEISDAPRFPHRAFMIDTARHFEPLTVFARLLDGMTACKLNTLHWHISDIQSVAFESQLFPQIWAGRFSQNERYSTADMAWVVEQARLRGIRVELEIDMPAHASSFCKGYPQLCANASSGRSGHCGLDISKNDTFAFIDGLVRELGTAPAALPDGSDSNSNNGGGIVQTSMPTQAAGGKAALFPVNFFHFGGDEVDTRCWGPPPGTNSNITGTYSFDPDIWKWLQANGNLSSVGFRDMGSYNPTTMQHYLEEALAYFYQRLDAIAFSHGKTPVHWVETFDALGKAGRLDKRAVIQICPSTHTGMCGYSKTTINEVVAAGYKAIYSDWSTFYLLHLDVSWAQVYDTEPLANITDPAQRALVLGAEVCKWGEETDASTFDGYVWPRLAAAAETFWSPYDETRTASSAEGRMEWFRCRLLQLGIAASPMHNPTAGTAPPGPGGCSQ